MSEWAVALRQEVSVKASQQLQDWELVRRSQAGDTEAFGELVTKYRTKIFTMVYGVVRNEHDARDLVQEGFLKAWRSIHRFERRSSFYIWLYSLMMNVTIYSLRRTRRRQEVELGDAIPSFHPGPSVARPGYLYDSLIEGREPCFDAPHVQSSFSDSLAPSWI